MSTPIHKEAHLLAGTIVKIDLGEGLIDYRLEDWWDRLGQGSWMSCKRNPACLQYAARSAELPQDNEVVYGKVGAFGHLIHISEIC